MNINKKFLSLAISAVLALGVVSYPMIGYSDNNDNEHGSSGSKKDTTSSNHGADSSKGRGNEDDSNFRGKDDSAKNSDSGKKKLKLTICHVPRGALNGQGNAKPHTIHISASAWPAHRDNHGGDYLGSCNAEIKKTVTDATGVATVTVQAGPGAITSADTSKVQYVVNSNACSDQTKRETLVTKVQSYFDPIVVNDAALDDDDVATAVSQCLDNGDSADSAKPGKPDNSKKSDSGKHKTGGKGQGRDSVSDSSKSGGEKIHKIRGCQDKDERAERKNDSAKHDSNKKAGKHGLSDSAKSDSNKNFRNKLKGADSVHDNSDSGKAKKSKEPIVVTDSSLDDKNVWAAVKKCAGGKDGDSNKLDSSKMGYHKVKGDSGKNKGKGDSGHKQHEIKASACGDSGSKALDVAVKAYKDKEKTSNGNIVLNEASLNDVSIQDALKACGIDDPRTSNTDAVVITVPKTTIENLVISSPSFSSGGSTELGGSVNGGTITSGTITGTVSGGTVTGGSSSNGVTTDATVTGTTVGNGSVTDATVSGVTVTNQTSDGTVISGTVIDGTISGGTIVSGGLTPVDTTGTGATTLVFTAQTPATPAGVPVSGTPDNAKSKLGRSNWREISKPAK